MLAGMAFSEMDRYVDEGRGFHIQFGRVGMDGRAFGRCYVIAHNGRHYTLESMVLWVNASLLLFMLVLFYIQRGGMYTRYRQPSMRRLLWRSEYERNGRAMYF
jgi:hypothetical protein